MKKIHNIIYEEGILVKNRKICLTDSNLRNLTKKLVLQSQKNNLIKQLPEAFKDVPAREEIHKGKKEYFTDCKE